jgi:hypothetical protein
MDLRYEEKRDHFGRFAAMDERFDWDDNGNCIYKGYALAGTPTSTAGFLVKKATYDGDNQVTLIQTVLKVAWDNRITSF